MLIVSGIFRIFSVAFLIIVKKIIVNLRHSTIVGKNQVMVDLREVNQNSQKYW